MIKVTYHRDINRVRIEGHAGSGEAGHDLVCASVSILAYTLAEFVKNTKELHSVYLCEGNAHISCRVPKRLKKSVTLVFDSICGGFELLARDYPDNVSFEMIGE